MNEATWYYLESGQQKGPVSETTLTELLTQGVLPDGTLVWRNGMSDWEPASRTFPRRITSVPPFQRVVSLQEDPQHSIKKTPVILIIIYTVITGGIYYPCWFLTRRDGVNSLNSNEKLGKGVFVFCIVIYSISLLLVIIGGVLEETGDMDLIRMSKMVDAFDNIISIVAGIILLVQCFKIKRILYEHVSRRNEHAMLFSGAATFFFGIFYLQYKMNSLCPPITSQH